MVTIQNSIDVNVPAHMLYQQLVRFEDYPRFLSNVERVRQVDDTHLHWTTRMANRPVEWDAEITEQKAGCCIAWHNTSRSGNTGKMEVQALSPDASKLIFTLQAEPGQFPGVMAGDTEDEMAQHLSHDLARLKDFVERGEDADAAASCPPGQGSQTMARPSPASISGSPTEVLDDEPNEAGPGT